MNKPGKSPPEAADGRIGEVILGIWVIAVFGLYMVQFSQIFRTILSSIWQP